MFAESVSMTRMTTKQDWQAMSQERQRYEAKRMAVYAGMVEAMDHEGFGNCTNTGACEVECPKGISIENIARMNREFLKASFSD